MILLKEIENDCFGFLYKIQAEVGPVLHVKKKFYLKQMKNKIFRSYLAHDTPGLPQKNVAHTLSSRLAGYREHIYIYI